MAENHLRVVSQAPAPQHEAYTPTADRIERLVSGFNESSYLPPKAELATAADEIETALIPAPEKMVEKAIAVMLAGYPSFRPEPLYIAGLVSDLGAYPLDVVIAVTNEIRRTQKFFPTHAEILTLAESLVQRRHKLRHQIGKAGRELERRDIEAEAAERDRQAERRRVMEIERRLVEHLGANAPPTGTYVRAEASGADFCAV